MKKSVLTLGICLALLQVSKPAQAQTMAKAQTTPIEIQAEQPQVEQPQTDETKAVASEKSILNTKDVDDTGYERGDLLFNPGITLGYYGLGYGFRGGFLPIWATLEYSINSKFAVGPYVGVHLVTNYNGIGFGGRFTFHGTGLVNNIFNASIDAKKFDFYASGILGYEIRPNYEYYDFSIGRTVSTSNSVLRLGVAVGFRYMFASSVGVFAELGPGAFGYSTLGLSFKF